MGCLPAPWFLTWSWPCANIPGISLCIPISSPYKDTGQVGWGLTLTASFNLITSKMPLSKYSYVLRLGFNIWIWGWVGKKYLLTGHRIWDACGHPREGLVVVCSISWSSGERSGLGMGKWVARIKCMNWSQERRQKDELSLEVVMIKIIIKASMYWEGFYDICTGMLETTWKEWLLFLLLLLPFVFVL